MYKCEDLYDRYCRLITPDKCYFSYNQKLCCKTCARYNEQLSHDTEEMRCPYGNRNKSCETMETNLCYNIYNRYMCCATCASVRTNMPECRYGDRDVHICPKVDSYMCYDSTIQKRCCGTCSKYETGRPECRYGDLMYLFERDNRHYSCEAYVGYFGYRRCRDTRESFFRDTCCQSCHDVAKARQWYRRSWFY
ncbi:hypothetical protein LSAT2_017889 [Lamellibrachia satsuma]|nr:hypothetical protein LSAT2_017889 [Lamellibrachia satsuma]